MTKISTSIFKEEEHELVDELIRNVDLFVLVIQHVGDRHQVVCHYLVVNPSVKPMAQRKQKFGKEKRGAISEEVRKLENDDFITEMKYLTWLANVVLVWKPSDKWRVCVNFTDFNTTFPKNPYPLPDIDHLIFGSSSYHTLSFMNSYMGYNYIKMYPLDAPTITFMLNHDNYYYNVMLFGLKNVGATYH